MNYRWTKLDIILPYTRRPSMTGMPTASACLSSVKGRNHILDGTSSEQDFHILSSNSEENCYALLGGTAT
jgi:hypothetical protein